MTEQPETEHDQARLREIDALVAEHVMGLRRDGDRWTSGKHEADLPGFVTQSWIALPRYTTSWDAAGQVIEKMRDMGYASEMIAAITRALADRSLVPLAVSLAALRALGVEVGE